MKLKKALILLTTGSMLLLSCETDSIEIVDNTIDLTTQIGVSAKEQVPNQLFDTTKQGIYHGIIASKTSQLRGKIWVNLANNSSYTATVEFVNGDTELFTGFKNAKAANKNRYTFIGDNGSFTVVEGVENDFEIDDLYLLEEDFHAYIIKSRSNRIATSYTGTFNDPSNPSFSGTWNILSNGINSPNGYNGTAISDVIVTFGSTMFTDTTMEEGLFQCDSDSNWVPIVDLVNFTNDGVLAFEQSSDFNGIVNWSLGRSNYINSSSYIDTNCNPVSGGTFSWTHETTNILRTGQILID